jgi:hypothetical protein
LWPRTTQDFYSVANYNSIRIFVTSRLGPGKKDIATALTPSGTQFDEQLFHIDGRRTGKMYGPSVDRMQETELGGVKRLPLETKPGKNGAQTRRSSSINRVTQ